MKLGFITSILDSWTYEEMMDFASGQGFECVEVACWPPLFRKSSTPNIII